MDQLIQFLTENLVVILIAVVGMKYEPHFTLIYLLGVSIWGNNLIWNIVMFVYVVLASGYNGYKKMREDEKSIAIPQKENIEPKHKWEM